ncbi:MAG: hypothetical protein RJA31_665 [Actinomycetota bacterium]
MTSSGARSRLQVSRRDLLVGAGAAVGAGAVTAATASALAAQTATNAITAVGEATEPFFGEHQAGVQTPHQAHGVFTAYMLNDSANLDTVRGVMRVATIEASRLCAGEPGMSDTDPTIATVPARLTVTFGFGLGLFDRIGMADKKPAGFAPQPAYVIDELRPEFSGGDLLIHIGSDDPLALAHASRHMSRVVSSIAVPHYAQSGFIRANGVAPHSETPRNLMGQKDGTENPRTEDGFAEQVWAGAETGWFAGGTQLVIRRIAMKLDTWDKLGQGDKEAAIGRRLASGAPLTGDGEFDVPDFAARNSAGLTVIPDFAHIRRAHIDDPQFRFLRRPLNYDDGINPDGTPNSGLIFAAYTTNITERYVPVQQRLADLDLLNVWTVPIGSSEFVIPPGVEAGGYIGQQLFDS